MSTVEAYQYEYDYIIDHIHCYRNRIKEVFIPSLKICFNIAENQFNVFKHDTPRNVIAQIRHIWSEETLEKAKKDQKLAKLIDESKADEIPEEPTKINHIQLDQSFVDKLMEIVKMNEYKKQVEEMAKTYLKK